jgi:hypothetical protein
MKTYYYVHTGHRIGLDRFRRAATVIRALKDKEITLLTSDFRIAQIAREFGVDDCLGLDVVRNIPSIAYHGDQLIFDSDEANPIMLEDMKAYFSKFIHVDTAQEVVDEKYFQKSEKTIPLAFFYGDDDYEKDIEKYIPFLQQSNAELLLGFYYFLDVEDKLKENLKNTHDYDEYDEVITSADILVSASPQAVLESFASGAKPIYLQREDYTDRFTELFEKYNIPVVKNNDIDSLNKIITKIDTHEYYYSKQMVTNFIENLKENLIL